jgi:stage II sporulation protein D
MKRSFLLLCTVLLVLGCALPCAAYRLACMALVVQGTAPSAAEAASVTSEESSRVASSPQPIPFALWIRAPGRR